ncbi:hypothetical protein LX32DRAFT_194435 [Colletotrichum zoysiae]|uniref:Uncharacterized protein n=1 Tax=Colletotrichum zoysiae TaxID=1216348 RepID=A0AAD9LVR5_9PEZI|nr:hypothetical protein LX32DRAFT_194435 [Colletotrichum zoysiae]
MRTFRLLVGLEGGSAAPKSSSSAFLRPRTVDVCRRMLFTGVAVLGGGPDRCLDMGVKGRMGMVASDGQYPQVFTLSALAGWGSDRDRAYGYSHGLVDVLRENLQKYITHVSLPCVSWDSSRNSCP